MRSLCRTTALLAGCVLAARLGAEELACKTDLANKDGSSRGVELKLTLERGRPTAIVFASYYASGEEGGAYFCNFQASTANRHSVWKDDAGHTAVTVLAGDKLDQDPTRESELEIAKTKDGYKVTFVSMSRSYCGFGAEFPDDVSVIVGRKACKVGFPSGAGYSPSAGPS